MKQQLNRADEYDVISRFWRRVHGYSRRAGVTAKVKRRLRRRYRREGKAEIHGQEH